MAARSEPGTHPATSVQLYSGQSKKKNGFQCFNRWKMDLRYKRCIDWACSDWIPSPMGAAFKCCAATWSGGYIHLEIHSLWYVLHQISLWGLIYWSQYFQFLVANLQELGPKERKCKFFIRTVAHNWCWTADRLARWGLTHPPRCPLCDQVGETIDHLMVSCVFTRQMWYTILQFFRLQLFAPQLGDLISVDWWSAVDSKVAGC